MREEEKIHWDKEFFKGTLTMFAIFYMFGILNIKFLFWMVDCSDPLSWWVYLVNAIVILSGWLLIRFFHIRSNVNEDV